MISSQSIFNTPLEYGLRALFLLDEALLKRYYDLQRLINYDYLMLYSGDVNKDKGFLHPPVPFRGSEWLIKREVLKSGIDLMYSKELLEKEFNNKGIYYRSSKLTGPFLKLLNSEYSTDLRIRAKWVISKFDDLSDVELTKYMQKNTTQWGAEFEKFSYLDRLEL